jgi:hypothetical protein
VRDYPCYNRSIGSKGSFRQIACDHPVSLPFMSLPMWPSRRSQCHCLLGIPHPPQTPLFRGLRHPAPTYCSIVRLANVSCGCSQSFRTPWTPLTIRLGTAVTHRSTVISVDIEPRDLHRVNTRRVRSSFRCASFYLLPTCPNASS